MLVQCDASQLEWRTILQLAQDEVGIAEIVGGEDTHSKNEKAFHLPSRLIAKIYLFRTIFRGSGYSFANDPDFMHVSASPKFWDDLNEKFFAKYYGINNCHYKWKDLVVNGKPIVSPLGRSWTIGMGRDWRGELKIPWTMLTNYPVQGTGADVMMLVRIMAYKRIKSDSLLSSFVVFVSTVHDSIVVDVPADCIQAVVDIFHSCFRDLRKTIWNNFKYDWNVPMDCECKVGLNMKDMKKVKPSAIPDI
jgi:DNA polymerase I-like protein with 3'-5' exonuclease and polymerase domains